MNNLTILILDAAPARQLARPLRELLQRSFVSAAIRDRAIAPPIDDNLWVTIGILGADFVLLITTRPALGNLAASLQLGHGRSARVPLIAVLDECEPHEVAALLRAGAADYVLPPLSACDVVPRIMRVLADQPP